MQNGQFFPQNAPFIHFSYEYHTFLIHSKIHSIVQQKYSFKEFIHSKKYLIIHSIKIFIFLKNAVSLTPMREPRGKTIDNHREKPLEGHPSALPTIILTMFLTIQLQE